MLEETGYTNADGAFDHIEDYYQPRRVDDLVLELACEDCGGSGVDVGSLGEPEACQVCLGSGRQVDAEVDRKPVTREVMVADCESVAEFGLGGGR